MIVENGSGIENADSYVDIDFADNYFSSRNPKWAEKTEEEKETALIKATDYINSLYKWHGKKKTQEQALAFPRICLVDSDGYKVEGIPLNVKKAVCVVAMEQGNGTLFETEERKGDIASESVSGAVSVSYFAGTKKENQSGLQEVNSLLRGLYWESSKQKIVTSKVVK